MNILRTTLLTCAATAALLAAVPAAEAHDRRGPRVGVHLGFGGPAWYGHPGWPRHDWGAPYWGPRVVVPLAPIVIAAPLYSPVVVERAPEVYVERAAPTASPAATQWWYWCDSANAYYPYVKACAEGWQPVPPQPAY